MNYKLTPCNHCCFITQTLEDGTCEHCKKDKSKEVVKPYVKREDVLKLIKKMKLHNTSDESRTYNLALKELIKGVKKLK